MFDAPTERLLPSRRVARVFLFRHGEVETGAARVCRGQGDVPLSPRGQAQSHELAARHVAAFGRPDRVLTSDLARCRELADAFCPAPEALPWLREQDMGGWEGRTWEELSVADGAAVSAYWGDYVHGRPTGGESWAEAARRVVAGWEALGPLEGHIVVCTHVGPIRALVCHWLGLGPGEALRFAPTYASRTRVLLADAGAVIESFGEPPG